MNGRVLVSVVLCCCVGLESASAGAFYGLGGPGIGDMTAVSVSADGSVVVGNASRGSGQEAFRWTVDGGLVWFADLPGGVPQAIANGVSGDGNSIVGNAPSTGGGFRWTEGQGASGIGLLSGGSFSNANSANHDGQIAVGYGNSGNSNGEALRWSASTGVVSLGDLPGGVLSSNAMDVSANGMVVAGSGVSASGVEAFRWTEATGMVGLGDLPGGNFESRAEALSADGSTIVGNSRGSNGTEAFRWTEATGMVGLGQLPNSTIGFATGVSGDGSRVVGWSHVPIPGFEMATWMWDEDHGMRRLEDVLATAGLGNQIADWYLASVDDISADGNTIVGWGYSDGGIPEAFVAVIPEPPSWLSALAVLAIKPLIRIRRRA